MKVKLTYRGIVSLLVLFLAIYKVGVTRGHDHFAFSVEGEVEAPKMDHYFGKEIGIVIGHPELEELCRERASPLPGALIVVVSKIALISKFIVRVLGSG
jgi:hypothetical protein